MQKESSRALRIITPSLCLFFTIATAFLISTYGNVKKEVKAASVAMEAEESQSGEDDVIDQDKSISKKDNISMEVTYGIRGNVKRGRNLPVKVSITNDGEDFNGKIQVYFNENDEYCRYQKDVMLASGETKDVPFAIPTKSMGPNIWIRLVDGKNKEKIREKFRIGSISNQSSNIYIGVLSDEQDRLSYLRRDENRVFFLKPEDIPDDAVYMESYDIIVLNNFNTGVFTPEQYGAIKGWVERGGTLVLGTGASGSKVWEVFKDDFITGSIGDVQTKKVGFHVGGENGSIMKNIIDSLNKDEEAWENGWVDDSDSQEASPNSGEVDENELGNLETKEFTKDVLTMDLKDAYGVYEEGGVKLVQRIDKGLGNVLAFAVDLGVDNYDKDALGTNLCKLIVDNISETKKNQIIMDLYGGMYNYQYGFDQTLSALNDNKLPNVRYYAVVLTVYIILVGPILYLVLKKMDKRKFLWAGIGVLASCFAIVIYLMGYSTRIHDPFMGFVDYLTLNPMGGAGSQEIYCNLTVPYTGTYRLDFDPSMDVASHTANYYYDDMVQSTSVSGNEYLNYKDSFHFGGESTEVELKDMGAFNSKQFLIKKVDKESGSYSCDLHYEDKSVTGSFTNDLGYDLTDMVLYCNRMMVYLGNVKDGETVSVSDNDKTGTFYVGNAWSSDTGNAFLKEAFHCSFKEIYNVKHDESTSKYFAIDKLIGESMMKNNDSFIVGFSNRKTDIVKNAKVKEKGLQVVIMPFEMDYSLSESKLVPTIDSYMVNNEGNFNSYASREIYDENVIITYNFGNEKVSSLSYREEWNPEFDFTNNPVGAGWYGSIGIYNWETNVYDTISQTQTTWEVTDLSKYLNQENMLILKYSPDTTKGYGSISLPYISAELKTNH